MTSLAGWCRGRTVAAALAGLFVLGCRHDMQDQPRYEPNSPSQFFPDGTSVRPLVEGVVARGSLVESPAIEDGTVDGKPIAQIPVAVDLPLLRRGRERYGIYCAPCHGGLGGGDGMIVQRGYRRPPSFHDERLRSMPDGHFYDVIARGFGVMPSYRAQVRTHDRWAIVAYIRALQLSQNARLDDVPSSERAALQAPPGGPR
jgi:mono/diheme cytochrome c family protein